MHVLCAYECVFTRVCLCSFLSLCVDARVHASLCGRKCQCVLTDMCAQARRHAHMHIKARERAHTGVCPCGSLFLWGLCVYINPYVYIFVRPVFHLNIDRPMCTWA